MDLVFAVSATGSQKERTFQLMKGTLGRIVDQYGTKRIRYGIVVYDRLPTVKLSFAGMVPNRQSLKRIIDSLPQVKLITNPF